LLVLPHFDNGLTLSKRNTYTKRVIILIAKKKRGIMPLFLMFFNYLQEKILLLVIFRAKV